MPSLPARLPALSADYTVFAALYGCNRIATGNSARAVL